MTGCPGRPAVGVPCSEEQRWTDGHVLNCMFAVCAGFRTQHAVAMANSGQYFMNFGRKTWRTDRRHEGQAEDMKDRLKTWRTGRWKLVAQPCPISRVSAADGSQMMLAWRGDDVNRQGWISCYHRMSGWQSAPSVFLHPSVAAFAESAKRTSTPQRFHFIRRYLVDILPWNRHCGVCRLDPILMANGTFYSESHLNSICRVLS